MAKNIIGTDGQADQRGKSHSIVLRAVLLCAGLVLAGCGTQEDGQAESRQEEQMKGQSEERSDEKPEGQPEGQSEGRLEDQAGESGAPVFEISPKLLEYRGMTYGEFQEESGREAEFLHGTFYFALPEELDVCVVFSGEYDEEAAGAVLTAGRQAWGAAERI